LCYDIIMNTLNNQLTELGHQHVGRARGLATVVLADNVPVADLLVLPVPGWRYSEAFSGHVAPLNTVTHLGEWVVNGNKFHLGANSLGDPFIIPDLLMDLLTWTPKVSPPTSSRRWARPRRRYR
jgi:hypothetical protein